MWKTTFCAILFMYSVSGAYAQAQDESALSPTPQDLKNQKELQADPLFPSIYRGHVDAIIGDLVNKECKILPELESKELTNNTVVTQQKLLPVWLEKHFQLSGVHKLKLLTDAAMIAYDTSQKYIKDCNSPSTQEVVKSAKNNQECNLSILLNESKDLSCFSFYKAK